MSSERYFSVFEALSAFFLWSTLGVFFNRVSLPVSVYVVFGSLVGLCFLYLYFYLVKRAIPEFTFSWALVGLFLVAAIKGVVWFKALTIYPVAKAMLIHNLAPVVAIILAPIMIKERPSFNHVIAVVTGFLGLATLLKFDSLQNTLALGAALSIVAAISSGLQDIFQRKLSTTLSGAGQSLIFILGQALGSVFFLVPALPYAISWTDFSNILFFGIVGTALPIILLSRSFVKLKAFEVSIIGYAEPALGALWGAFFLGQAFVPSTAIGGLLIFISGLTAVKQENGR